MIAAVLSQNIGQQLALYRRHYWLCCIGVLFMLPVISGLWSENISAWQRFIEIKLPLLLLPFCSVVFTKYSPATFTRVNISFIAIIVIGCGWSLWQYVTDISEIQQDYLKARVIPTLMSNEYVRFSWAVVIAYLVLLYESIKNFTRWNRVSMTIAIITIVFFTIYLQVLSSKTGIISFYLVNTMLVIYFLRRKAFLFLLALAMILLLPLLSWFLLPTFQNRVKFVWWDFQNYTRGNYVEGLSDAPRIVSGKAAWHIVKQHPLAGTGFGDLNHEMFLWYDRHAAYLRDYERLMPSNEWLLYSAGAGIPAGLIFLVVVFMPFLLKSLRKNIYWICIHLIACVIFVYEIPLETQHGVFLYTFFGIWFYWMQKKNDGHAMG